MKIPKSIAALALAVLTLGVTAQKAQAVTYTCDNGLMPVPANVTGSAVVQQTGNCTIAAGIIATGTIDITVISGTLTVGAGLQGTAVTASTSAVSDDITTQAITATSGGVSVTSGGKVTTTNLTSTPADILISAPGNVATDVISAGSNFGVFTQTGTGTIKITGTVTTGTVGAGNVLLQSNGNIDVTSNITAGNAVEIEANMNQATSTVFKIGASSSNGVGGTIKAPLGVFVVNGNTSATGGLTITNGNKINVANSASVSGVILLNAQNGTLTLSAGKLSADGATGQAAGLIVLLANAVSAGASTTITASQANSVAATYHYVDVAANTLSVAGTTIEANGNGTSTNLAQVDLGPPGYVGFTSNEDVDFLLWNVVPGGTSIFTTNLPFTVNGTGALTVNANGSTNNIEIAIGGYPIVFSNAGNVTLQSKGNGTFTAPHLIQLGYLGTLNGTPGLTFSNTGTVLIDASGSSGNNAGGQIQIQLDQFSVASSVTSFTLHADGLGTGNAGVVGFFPSKATFSDATTLITANGAGSTSVSSPNINFGVSGATTVNSTTFTVSANALASANKNAGIISFSSNPITLGSSTLASIKANGPTSANGAGGTITLNPAFFGTLKLGSNQGDLSLSATGGAGTGSGNNGGTIIVNNGPAITLDTAQATALNVSVPAGTGNGGTITIFPSSMTFTGSGYALNANSGMTQGNGGKIDIDFSTSASLTVGTGAGDVQISATGLGTGNGGTVDLTAGSLTVAGGNINVSAGTSGNGGTIDLTATNSGGNLEIDNALNASAGSTQGTGGNVTITADNTLTSTTGLTITATSSGSGQGGMIDVDSVQDLTVSGTGANTFNLDAHSTGTGNGGTVIVASNASITIAGANINVVPGTNGVGGSVTANAGNSLNLTGTINAAGNGTGSGGAINLNAASSSALSLSSAAIATSLVADSGNAGGNGGEIAVTNTQGSVLVIQGTKLSATAAETGTTGNGGSISLTAGSSGSNGAITITGEGTSLTADSGLGGGNGGTVNFTYTDSSGGLQLTVTTATVSANQLGSSGAPGSINVANSSSAGITLSLDGGQLSASGGALNFKGSTSQAVTVIANEDTSAVVPLLGSINATGSSASFTITVKDSTRTITMGNVNVGTSTVQLTMNGGGNVDQASGTSITGSTLNLTGQFATVGVSRPLQANVSNLNDPPAGSTQTFIDELSVLTSNSNIIIGGDGHNWTIGTFFLLGGSSIGVGSTANSVTIEQTGPPTASPQLPGVYFTGSSSINVTEHSSLIAQQGNVDITAGTTIVLGFGSTVAANANGTDSNLGNVSMLASTATPMDCTNGSVANVSVFPTTATYSCGPNLFTTDAPVNNFTIANRLLSIVGPLVSSISVDGSVTINAIGTAH